MSVFEQHECHDDQATGLIQGEKARIKNTGQIVTLKRISEHGVSVVSFCGSEYFISNMFLEPVIDFQ